MALTEIDRTLLKRCLSQEPGSWKDLVDRFIGLFVHVVQHAAHARSVNLSAADVDDLCADIFLALIADDFAVLRQFKGKSSLATYLTVISRRVVVKKLSERRMAEALGHVQAHQEVLDKAHANRDHQRVEDREEIALMLDGLPRMDAEIVRQFHIEGRTYREISSGLGVPENSIGPTLTRARARLRTREMQQR